MQSTYDAVIIGAGAAGLMCAIEAGKRQRRVLVIDHANKVGKKILMSGGGRCNFTNYHVNPSCYLSANPHFCKSALKRYTQWDFIQLVETYQIAYHEKTLGQLFCNNKAKSIVNMLLTECQRYGVTVELYTSVTSIKQQGNQGFLITIHTGQAIACSSLVIATGGRSIPTMGATGFGYDVANQFDLPVLPQRAGLVPFTWSAEEKATYQNLSGIAVAAYVQDQRGTMFHEQLLFTHRGLSGPAILQISSYWQPGEAIYITLVPEIDLFESLLEKKQTTPRMNVRNALNAFLPKRLIDCFIEPNISEKTLANIPDKQLKHVAECFTNWVFVPTGTEGYKTAEVTLGGVCTDALSSKTMATKNVDQLYFIGEVVDVTGWLGGYNFQWAWSSGWAAGQVI